MSLSTALEHLEKRHRAVRANQRDGGVHLDHRQPPAGCRNRVTLAACAPFPEPAARRVLPERRPGRPRQAATRYRRRASMTPRSSTLLSSSLTVARGPSYAARVFGAITGGVDSLIVRVTSSSLIVRIFRVRRVIHQRLGPIRRRLRNLSALRFKYWPNAFKASSSCGLIPASSTTSGSMQASASIALPSEVSKFQHQALGPGKIDRFAQAVV